MTLTAARRFLAAPIPVLCVLCLALTLSACTTRSHSSEEQDAPLPLPPSTQLRMSGEYVMNEDGTLQQPTHTTPLPTLDPKALEYTPDGAELAARHFLALTEYAWATGDSTPMRAFFTPECEPCTHMAERVDKMYSSGGWMTGTEYQVEEVIRVEEIPEIPHTFGVQLILKQGASTSYADGTLHKRESKDLDMLLFIQWDRDTASWKVTAEDAQSIQ